MDEVKDRSVGRSVGVCAAAAVVAAFALGAVTSWAQGWLPDAVASFANSAGGWTLLTVLVIWLARLEEVWSAVVGAAAFVALVLGYTVASELRGFTYDPVLFGVVGLVAGPLVGLATAWLRCTGWRPHAAAAFLGGIGIGEAAYGLTVVEDSTSPVYWTISAVVGAALVAAVLWRRPAGTALRIATVVATLAEAATFVLLYRALPGVGF